MAEIAAAFASSHSIMLTAELADWLTGFVASDQRMPHLDTAGEAKSYAELAAAAAADSAALITPAAITRRYHDAEAAMARLRQAILGAGLDALIVIGDDQRELFPESLQPALAIYYGASIRNAGQRGDLAALEWFKRAQERRREPGGSVDYPCDAALGLYLAAGLNERGFEVTALKRLAPDQAEGHAFSFVHRKYLGGSGLPIVPIMLNTYYPPNQPTPPRCLALGRAIGALIREFPKSLRIGVMASGGLSHFTVNEPLDRAVLAALAGKDMAALAALPVRQLQSGSSEIRNWLVAAAAASELDLAWTRYLPSYRTPALTGTGLGFAQWRAAQS